MPTHAVSRSSSRPRRSAATRRSAARAEGGRCSPLCTADWTPRWNPVAPSALLRQAALASGRYRWLAGRAAVSVGDHGVTDDTGERHRGDLVVLCTGATHTGLAGEVLHGAPVRRVRLQMLETASFAGDLTTSVADGDSLRYYPSFDVPERTALSAQDPLAAKWASQLLMVQRLDGALTVGDTHSYDEPFAFDLDEAPYSHLTAAGERLLGSPLPPVVRRWAGVYSQLTASAGDTLYLRAEVAAGTVLVTGPGGRGMTLAPAIAAETFR